jgi:hypothetical protein
MNIALYGGVAPSGSCKNRRSGGAYSLHHHTIRVKRIGELGTLANIELLPSEMWRRWFTRIYLLMFCRKVLPPFSG